MADNLIFPIGFDLDAAVEKAGKEWDSKYADKLERLLAKRAVEVKLKLDTSKLSNLSDVKKRLADLKIEPITPATKTAIKELARELRQLASALEAVKKYSARVGGTSAAVRDSKAELNEQRAAAARELARQRAARAALAEEKLAQARDKSAAAALRNANATKRAYGDMESYLKRMATRMAAYYSVSQVSNFITKVREVTAEFELQRVSLGAIIQDQARANQLFSEIKSFALQSPVSILDLTKYTKQLAAYKIGVDELFETTKKLTDVAVGLGVSMDRVVLAYGQVRATGYLRACLGIGTPVLLYNGTYKNVEDIVVSDVLMGDDDKPRHVSKLYKGEQMMYRVRYKGGEFRCNEHHILTVYDRQKKQVTDVFVLDYLKDPKRYQGVKKMVGGQYIVFSMTVERDRIDTYYGFSIDSNHRFIIQDNIVTHNTEIRQFTEMGVPIVEELAKKLSAVNGELVRAADVMEMVSKREIPFEMVKDVFDDMTAAGGIFYDMQIKQGNTLAGMWAKLGDAASVMYDEIGNTEGVNEGMKSLIGLLTDLMRNWEASFYAIAAGLGAAGILRTISAYNAAIQLRIVKEGQAARATAARIAAEQRLNNALATGTIKEQERARATLKTAQANEAASISAAKNSSLLHRAWSGLKALGKGALKFGFVGAAMSLVYFFSKASAEAERLKNKLKEIKANMESNIPPMVNNFVSLAEAAVRASDGSKEQEKALSELKRTYSNIIPEQDLTIEKLRQMGHEYNTLTTAIREYMAQLSKQESVNAIVNEYGPKRKEAYDAALKVLTGMTQRRTNKRIFGEEQAKRILQNVEAAVGLGESFEWALRKQLKLEGMSEELWKKIMASAPLKEYAKLLNEFNNKLKETEEGYKDYTGVLGEYTDKYNERFKGMIANNPWNAIQALREVLDMTEEESRIFEGFEGDAKASKAFWEYVESLAGKTPQLRNLVKQIKEDFFAQIPSSEVTRVWRNTLRDIIDSYGESYAALHKATTTYQMKDSENLKDYRKRIKDWYDGIIDDIIQYNDTRAKLLKQGADTSEQDKLIEEAQKKKNIAERLLALLPLFPSATSGQSDPRIGILQEMVSTLKQINKEFEDLEQKKGWSQALTDTQRIYDQILKNMKLLAKQYKFDLPDFGVPTDVATLTKYLDAIKSAMAKLPKSDKVVLSLGVDIAKLNIDAKQKEIEEQLKELSERIVRTKAAKEFYDKILSQTGDLELAANVTMSVYGDTGEGLQDALLEQIREAFAVDAEGAAELDLSYAVDMVTGEVDYNKLAELAEQYDDMLMKGRADLRKKLIEEGRKTSAAQAQQWLKDIEKAKDYAQQRIELAAYTANQIAAINARRDLDSGTKDALIQGYREREAKQSAKLEYEAFKDSAMYVHIFENLDNASTTALRNMRDRLVALKGQWKNLDPTQVKELTKAIADLEAQIAGRNPFKALADSFKALAKARPQKLIDADLEAANIELDNRKAALEAATKQYTDAQTALLNAQADVAAARENLSLEKEASGGEETPEVVAARKELALRIEVYNAIKKASNANIAAARLSLDEATEQYNTQKATVDRLIEESRIREANILRIENANQAIDKYQEQINEALDGVRKIMESFAAADEDMQFFDDIVSALNEIVDAGQKAAMSVASFMSRDYIGGITQGISAIGSLWSGLNQLFSAGKMRKANKEIRNQANELERLQKQYEALERAAERAFGGDYLRLASKQLKTLRAEAEAYRKQAEAERSKGKGKDEDALKEYENQYRETLEAIEDKQREVVDRMTGTSREDIARKMAESWIDARASMSDTFAAIKGDYKDMIRSMIVEGMAAKVIESALAPMWKSIDEMLADNDISGAIDYLVNGMDRFLGDANNGMEVLWQRLEARGYDMKKLLGDADGTYTGIKREVASATSEEMNANTAALNTQNYYISRQLESMQAIQRLLEERLGTASHLTDVSADAVDAKALYQQAMEHLGAISRHTAETVTECRNIAASCKEQTDAIRRVVLMEQGVGKVRVKIQ